MLALSSLEVMDPELASKALSRWQDRPDEWLKAFFGVELWPLQREILLSVFKNRRTAVKSCYGSGKSFVAACATIAWHHLYPYSAVVVTSKSARQVRNNVWAKIHMILQRKKAPFKLVGEFPGSERLQMELRMAPDWIAFGFATDEPGNIQGVHPPSGRILVIADESDELEPEIHDRLEALMTSEFAHRLDIGNPLDPDGRFAALFKRPNVAKFTISAFDVIEQAPDIPGLVSRTWVEERRAEWGEDSPLWRSQVLGEFPESSKDALIPLAWIRLAQERWHSLKPEGKPVAGVDIARYGFDESVLCLVSGRYVHPLRVWTGASTAESVGYLREFASEAMLIRVDEIGLGAGVVDQARQEGLPVVGVNVQTKATQPEKYQNLRAELYFRLRDLLNPENPNAIGIPPDDVLAGQLASIRYRIVDSGGKIAIESKEEMRERGLRSPDRADALMLAVGVSAGLRLDARPIIVGEGTGAWGDDVWGGLADW